MKNQKTAPHWHKHIRIIQTILSIYFVTTQVSILWADIVLPYSVRTQGYAAWDTALRGDIRTIGMSGALVGLADSEISALENPAGLAKTLDKTGLAVTKNEIQDGTVQSYAATSTSTHVFSTLSEYPWGFGIASWAPHQEGDIFRIHAPQGPRALLSIESREYLLAGSRMFFDDHLALGIKFNFGKIVERQNFPELNLHEEQVGYGFGFGFGAIYRLQHRLLLGINYKSPVTFHVRGQSELQSPDLQSFYQDAKSPAQLGFGLGWIPNRVFRTGTSFHVIGTTNHVALLSDQNRRVGEKITFQPRTGFSYLFCEFKELRGEISAGTYFEVLRVNDLFGRLHGTLGLELQVWVINLGWGLDESKHYQNFIYSAGIDLGKTLEKLELLKKQARPPRAGFLPNPFYYSDIGLPRTVVDNWKGEKKETIFDVGREFPRRLEEKLKKAPQDLMDLPGNVIDSVKEISEP